MNMIVSQKNGCTYILDHNEELLYAPMMKNGSVYTDPSQYDIVELDCLDKATLTEAKRCYTILFENSMV